MPTEGFGATDKQSLIRLLSQQFSRDLRGDIRLIAGYNKSFFAHRFIYFRMKNAKWSIFLWIMSGLGNINVTNPCAFTASHMPRILPGSTSLFL